MSPRGESARSMPRGTRKSSRRSSKLRAARSNRKRQTVKRLSDRMPLSDVLYATYACVRCASLILNELGHDGANRGAALATLHHGVTVPGTAVNRLEEVEFQISRIRRKVGGTS